MKELNQHTTKGFAAQEIQAPMQHESRKEFVGSFHPRNGQKVWQLCRATGEITEAEFETPEVRLHVPGESLTDYTLQRKLITKAGHLYCIAINKKNAFKQFLKQLQFVNTIAGK
jgi:hypothetical protein